MAPSTFIYVTYIRTTPQKLWHAITTTDFMARYWCGIRIESEWRPGAAWKMFYPDGTLTDSGTILEMKPPRRIVFRWRNEFRPELKAEGWSRCAFDLTPVAGAVKLTVTHTINRPKSKFINAVSGGWPSILSNLKSMLENGKVAFDLLDAKGRNRKPRRR